MKNSEIKVGSIIYSETGGTDYLFGVQRIDKDVISGWKIELYQEGDSLFYSSDMISSTEEDDEKSDWGTLLAHYDDLSGWSEDPMQTLIDQIFNMEM